jgi:hypothetical protein
MWKPILVCLFAVACGSTTPGDPMQPSDPLPMASGSYRGQYRVPTSPELAAAALYAVDHIDWTVAAGAVTLHYKLPPALVGGVIDLTLAGPISDGMTQVDVAGAPGVGTCVATTSTITCREEFSDLGVLPISMPVVESLAALQYAGPASDRVSVAMTFASDPIGFVEIDLSSPVPEDNPKPGDDHP